MIFVIAFLGVAWLTEIDGRLVLVPVECKITGCVLEILTLSSA